MDIVKEMSVPRIDHYAYPIEGRAWVAHEWLFEVTTYLIYIFSGYVGLGIFFSLFIILFYIISLKNSVAIIDQKNNSYLFSLIFVFGLLGASPHLGVRMQTITLIGISIILLIILKDQEKEKIRNLLFLPPLFWLWANLHGSFLIGFCILGLWWVLKIAKLIFSKKFQISPEIIKSERRYTILLLLIIIGCFLATLLNPYGADIYGFLKTYGDTFYLSHIEEWQNIFALQPNIWKMVYYGLGIALVIAASIEKKYRKLFKSDKIIFIFLLNLILFILSIKSSRNFLLFFASSLPMYSWLLTNIATSISNDQKPIDYRWALNFSIILMIIIIIFNMLNANWRVNPFNFFCYKYPCAAIQYIKASGLQDKKIFNNYDWGGYLLWTWPEKKIFIDGRLPQLPLNGKTYLEEYDEILNSDNPQKILDEFGIELILSKKEKLYNLSWIEQKIFKVKIKPSKNNFNNYLENSLQWKEIYSDRTSRVFLKNQ
jgi:hypothetical protein